MEMEENIREDRSQVSVISIPRTDSTHQINELAGLIAGINDNSQLRLTVVPSEEILNSEARKSHSAELISGDNSNLTKKKNATIEMSVIAEQLNQ